MKYKDWSDFVVCCSKIHEVVSFPKGVRPFTEKQSFEYDTILKKKKEDGQLSEKQIKTLEVFNEKKGRLIDPELSKVAINYLLRRYGFEKYNKRIAATGFSKSTIIKGNEQEAESINLLSRVDKLEYKKCEDIVRNDFIYGICDVITPSKDKIIDIKTSWNINTFLPYRNCQLDKSHWFQMQGYLELYNIEVGEVCFVLLNTPQYLVDREMAKYTEKYIFGEISREQYDEQMVKLEYCFNYNKIPLKRRVIRFRVTRCSEVMSMIQKKVYKCRYWLSEFEKSHTINNAIEVNNELYLNNYIDDAFASDND